MKEVKTYYKDRINTWEWGKLDEDEEQVIALRAQLAAKISNKRVSRRRGPQGDDKPSHKDWKTKLPKPNEPQTEKKHTT